MRVSQAGSWDGWSAAAGVGHDPAIPAVDGQKLLEVPLRNAWATGEVARAAIAKRKAEQKAADEAQGLV